MTDRNPPTELKIETGIPIPPGRFKMCENVKTLMAMKPGDSVLVGSNRHMINFYQAAKRENIRIVCRTQYDGKVRIWKTDQKMKD